MNPDSIFENYTNEIPQAPKPMGVYIPLLIIDKMVYVSGHGPNRIDGSQFTGRIGSDNNIEYGYLAARQVGLTILATLKTNLGSLNKIKRVVKVLGMVNADSDFLHHPKVINGCSDLFKDIWGETNGIGVRSAVGMGSLPGDISVEIEAIFELH